MSTERKRMNLNDFDHQMIIAAMTNMVDKGLTPHQVLEVVDDIKQNIFHGLVDIYKENKTKGGS